MEAVVLAFVLGAGTVVAVRHGRAVARKIVGFTAQNAGRITGQVRDSIEQARRVARAEYERGRDQLRLAAEIPPPLTNGTQRTGANGTSGTHGVAHANPPPSVREGTPPPSPGE
jgi:hypothetical protein